MKNLTKTSNRVKKFLAVKIQETNLMAGMLTILADRLGMQNIPPELTVPNAYEAARGCLTDGEFLRRLAELADRIDSSTGFTIEDDDRRVLSGKELFPFLSAA